jgi:DNA-binding NarL/FixJ family response regulator
MTSSSLDETPLPQPMHPLRILIADRNQMGSQLLAESLEQDSRFEVTAVATPADILPAATARKTHMAVISADFDSSKRKGMQIARLLNARQPAVLVVILLDFVERDSVISSFRNGARGVFCRTEPLSEFRKCIDHVSSGRIWANSTEGEYLLDAVRSTPFCDAVDRFSTLSKREVEVIEAAVTGHTNKEIAHKLGLSGHTIKNYLFSVFEKLGVSNRVELLCLLLEERKDLEKRALKRLVHGEAHRLEPFVKAAEDGFILAQFVVGMAHLDGCGIQKSDDSAYYWLRVTEQNSFEILQRSRIISEQIKQRMQPEEIMALEQKIATTVRNNETAFANPLSGLFRESVDLLTRRFAALAPNDPIDSNTEKPRGGDSVRDPFQRTTLKKAAYDARILGT